MTLKRKINRLQQLLVTGKGALEQVASNITDNALRCTVLSLAQQNNQYAAELSTYLVCTGTTTTTSKKNPVVTERISKPKETVPGDEKQVLAFCSSNEKKLMLAYRKVLKESAIYEGLQKMIGYQLGGISSACTQLKLLSSLKRRYYQD